MRHLNKIVFFIAVVFSAQGISAETGTAKKKDKPAGTATVDDAAATKDQGSAVKRPSKTVKYTKNKKVEFGDQNIEGNIQRPKAALITGSESGNDSGILRLREDFLDKFAADNGEEIK